MTASAKKKPNFFPVEKLFVLGAGASFAATRQFQRINPEIPPLKQTPLDGNFTKILSNTTSVKGGLLGFASASEPEFAGRIAKNTAFGQGRIFADSALNQGLII